MTAGVVVTICGLGREAEEGAEYLRGYATAEGRQWRPLTYPAAPRQSSITEGAAALHALICHLLVTTDGPIDVIGMSQGAQVIGEWLATYGSRPNAPDPSRVRFICLGNPGRRLGANPSRMGWNGKRVALTPDNTRYTVIDIARRWDGWANWENFPVLNRRNLFEVARLLLGMATDHSGAYHDLDFEGLEVRAVVGNTTYYVAP